MALLFVSLPRKWDEYQDVAQQTKDATQQQLADATAGNVPGTAIANFGRTLFNQRARMVAIAGVAGIATYVNSLTNKPAGYDVVAEHNATMSALTAVVDLIASTPTLGDRTWNSTTGAFDDKRFTAAELATYRSRLSSLLTALG